MLPRQRAYTCGPVYRRTLRPCVLRLQPSVPRRVSPRRRRARVLPRWRGMSRQLPSRGSPTSSARSRELGTRRRWLWRWRRWRHLTRRRHPARAWSGLSRRSAERCAGEGGTGRACGQRAGWRGAEAGGRVAGGGEWMLEGYGGGGRRPAQVSSAVGRAWRQATLRWVSQLEQISELELSLQRERREKAEV